MNKHHLFLIFGAIIFALLIFQLPRSVVENEKLQDLTDSDVEGHSLEMPKEINEKLNQLTSLYYLEKNSNKKANFAFEIANVLLNYGQADSAFLYAKQVYQLDSLKRLESIADIYYRAHQIAGSEENRVKYAHESKLIYEKLLDEDLSNTFFKNRLAMSMIVSKNPMEGVQLLQEITEKEPNNRQSLLNLGLLSIQSGQFEKAKARFETLVKLDTIDFESKLYLAVTCIETNQLIQAKEILAEIVSSKDSIPAIKSMAINYLNSLENS